MRETGDKGAAMAAETTTKTCSNCGKDTDELYGYGEGTCLECA